MGPSSGCSSSRPFKRAHNETPNRSRTQSGTFRGLHSGTNRETSGLVTLSQETLRISEAHLADGLLQLRLVHKLDLLLVVLLFHLSVSCFLTQFPS